MYDYFPEQETPDPVDWEVYFSDECDTTINFHLIKYTDGSGNLFVLDDDGAEKEIHCMSQDTMTILKAAFAGNYTDGDEWVE